MKIFLYLTLLNSLLSFVISLHTAIITRRDLIHFPLIATLTTATTAAAYADEELRKEKKRKLSLEEAREIGEAKEAEEDRQKGPVFTVEGVRVREMKQGNQIFTHKPTQPINNHNNTSPTTENRNQQTLLKRHGTCAESWRRGVHPIFSTPHQRRLHVFAGQRDDLEQGHNRAISNGIRSKAGA